MNYTEINLQLNPVELFGEMLTYQLGEVGFEMFEDTPEGFKAYIQTDQFNQQEVLEIIEEVKAMNCQINYTIQEIPWQNWNAEWEKNYQPEIIGDKIYVRAEFHEANTSYPHEIIVQPRMAFGTGHHPTTSQVMEAMLDIDFKNIPDVIDVNEPTFEVQTVSSKTSKPITLKKHKDVLYEMYKIAKQKANEMKRAAMRAYLEAKEIKAKYLLDDLDDLDSESSDDDSKN